MSISSEHIDHIAHLARLELNTEEKKHLAAELAHILSFVETLSELDTKDIEPVTGSTLLSNIMREDEQTDIYMENKSGQLMEAAVEKKEDFIKVKSVFE